MRITVHKLIAIAAAALAVGAASSFPVDAASRKNLDDICRIVPIVKNVSYQQSPGAAGQQSDRRASTGRESSTRVPTGRSSAGTAANVLVATDEDYRIGVGDVIEVEIEDAPELSGNFRITAAGTFLMHYLGRVTAQNKTTEELSKFIADGLRERYIFDPRVTVTVKQYNSRSFFIQGAVQSAGVYQIEGRPSLLELITLAGGLQQNHGSTAFIIRKNKQPVAAKDKKDKDDDKDKDEAQDSIAATNNGGKGEKKDQTADSGEDVEGAPRADAAQYTMTTVSVNGLLKGRFDQNMFLEPGDIVNIPQTEVFFVGGEVKSPGSFPLKEGTTLRQALSLAQGLNFSAAGKGIIFRQVPGSDKHQEIQVDLGAVMNGKKEDLPIYPNDIVMIPNSKLKKVAGPVLSAFAVNSVLLPMRF